MKSSNSEMLLKRLAMASQRHHERWRLCDLIRVPLDQLKRAGIWTVAGEAELLAELDRRLQLALERFRDLLQSPDESDLREIEGLLEDVAWDLAEDVRADLEAKLARQQDLIRHFTEQVAEWGGRLNDLRSRLDRALKVQAPVLREVNEFRQLEAHVAQAERMLREPNYAEVQKALQSLESISSASQQLADRIDRREQESRRYMQQADLLLLQSPAERDSRRLHYTVLLRTPSEPGTHGINIESSSTLVGEDSTELRSVLNRVTEAINSGLARKFDLGAPPSVANPPQPSHDLTVGLVGTRGAVAPIRVNDLVRDIGDLLYRLVIPEQMQAYLTGSPFSLTITTNDLELPWELMYVEDDFLCLRLPVARMPMGRALPRRPRLRARGEKFRFLLVYADPEENLPLARQEVEKIAGSLRKDWGDKIVIDLLMPPDSSGRRMNEALRRGQYDVIHYAGHAGFDQGDGDLSGLLLHDGELFFAQKVRRLLEGRPLVFLNACESAFTANERQPQKIGRYLQGPAEGLASSFIYGGAVGCIGSLWPVYDGPAAEFAVSLYGRVLEGYTIGEAMRLARMDSRAAHPDQVTWATFVLYGDPRFHLVD